MKKIYAFLAAALLSVSMFAAPAKVPTVADLAAAYDVANDVVLCLYFDEEVCNDVVLAGNYNCWNVDNPADLKKFEPLAGFDGWYVVSIPFQNYVCDPENNPEGDLPAAKPVQLKADGSFSWDFQSGDVDAWVNMWVDGSQVADVAGGFNSEADIKYPTAGAYIYEVAYFKEHKSPCVFIPTHKYTIRLYDPTCEGMKPAISGDFNGWATPPTPMNETMDEDFNKVYELVVEDEEGHGFKFREANDDSGWSNQIQHFDEETQAWVNFDNFSLPVASGDTTLVFDFSDLAKYRYPNCGADETEYTVSVVAKLPAGAPAAGVEIVGSFEGWAVAPVLMTVDAEGNYTAQVIAKESDEFKFREAGTWDNEVIFVADGSGLPNTKFGEVWADQDGAKVINIDFSDPTTYAWKVPSALENIKFDATEGIRKVVIDGSIYIIKGNAVYNVMGAQVR